MSKADPWITEDLRDSCSLVDQMTGGRRLPKTGWIWALYFARTRAICIRIQVVFCATLTHRSQTHMWTESCSSTLLCLCVQGGRISYPSPFQVHLEYKVAEKLKVYEKAQRSFLGHYFTTSHLWNGNSQAHWNMWISLLL